MLQSNGDEYICDTVGVYSNNGICDNDGVYDIDGVYGNDRVWHASML